MSSFDIFSSPSSCFFDGLVVPQYYMSDIPIMSQSEFLDENEYLDFDWSVFEVRIIVTICLTRSNIY